MSWLRTAVNKAVEVGGNNNITRTVRTYADTVVHHAGNAVAGGAKIIQDRIGVLNLKSFRLTVKRLEDLSVSCRGIERVQLLRRWLLALKEVERLSTASSRENNIPDLSKEIPPDPTMDYYIDPDGLEEPMNFRHVFLHSQALEGMMLSMILETPNDEEVLLLLEIFALCLSGGKEVHTAVISSIQDMATAFSHYEDEVLAKREELLQYAQVAIAGLKINADSARIDAEASSLMEKLNKMKAPQQPSNGSHESSSAGNLAIEDLKDLLGQIQLYSQLEALLLKTKSSNNGDSAKIHAQKVDKLKVLAESLANSALKAEERVLDHRCISAPVREKKLFYVDSLFVNNRYQKEEALNYRVTKTNEVCELEKELVAEIKGLEEQRNDLEAKLKEVNTSLIAARGRLHNAREEGDQFDEASNQILMHLKTKEDELARSIASYRVEAEVVSRCIKFLEDTWVLQTSYSEEKEKNAKAELETYQDHFINLVIHFVSAYKEELVPTVARVRKLVEHLRSSNGLEAMQSIDESSKPVRPRKNLEEEYLDIDAKLVTTLSIVDAVKKHFYAENEGIYRKDTEKLRELFDALENLKEEFESMDRPMLEVETPRAIHRPTSPSSNNKPLTSLYPSSNWTLDDGDSVDGKMLDKAVKNVHGRIDLEDDGRYSTEEIIDEWEFDRVDKDLKTSAST